MRKEGRKERKIWSEYHEEVQMSFSYSTQLVVNMSACHFIQLILSWRCWSISPPLWLLCWSSWSRLCVTGVDQSTGLCVVHTASLKHFDFAVMTLSSETSSLNVKSHRQKLLFPSTPFCPTASRPFCSPLPSNPVSCPKAAGSRQQGGRLGVN